MKISSSYQSPWFNLRIPLTFTLCSGGLFFALLSFAAAATPLVPVDAEWSIISSPNSSNSRQNVLFGVACPSASDCWAVGRYDAGTGVDQTLLQHWDGSTWSIATSPNTSVTQENTLNAVACASSSECWAVGYYIDNSQIQQLQIQHWNGTAWTIVPAPNPVTPPEFTLLVSDLFGVTCDSVSSCWAVGYYAVGTAVQSGWYQTLIEHWDGTSWSVAVSPNVSPAQGNLLYGATCTSGMDCWAVGEYYSSSSSNVCNDFGCGYQTLTAHWDGLSWTIIPSPNNSPSPDDCVSIHECFEHNTLDAVACTSASDCWAVGNYFNGQFGEGGVPTLIEHWDGISWNIVASPSTSDRPYDFLNGVSCLSTSDCWAAGDGGGQTLIEHWDGISWAIVSSPNTSTEHNDTLSAVTCVSASNCWAVGDYYAGSSHPDQTLLEHYGVPVRQIGAVSRMGHGAAGAYDVDLTDGRAIECRSGGPNGDYTVVFSFANTLTSVSGASISSGTGLVISSDIDGNDPHNYIVSLTGVVNAQTISVTLTNVSDSAGGLSSAISAQMGMLIGDVNASRRVDAADVSSVRQQTLQPVTATNFRNDLNASGRIDAADVSIARQQTLTSLP